MLGAKRGGNDRHWAGLDQSPSTKTLGKDMDEYGASALPDASLAILVERRGITNSDRLENVRNSLRLAAGGSQPAARDQTRTTKHNRT